MVKTRVTCYFPVENAREAKLGAFAVWYVDVDVEATDTKTDVRKAIALATGAKFSRLKIRLGMFNELLAFEDGRYGAVLKVGSCGASAATRDERLLTAHELNDLGAGSASDLPDWDPSKYDGRYGWVQEVKEHWKSASQSLRVPFRIERARGGFNLKRTNEYMTRRARV